RLTATTVELFHRGTRIASHVRNDAPGRHTTVDARMTPAHQAVQGWNAPRLLDWAGRIGPHAKAVVESIMHQRRHPQQGYRACLGILRFGKTFGEDRLEAACERAIAIGAMSYSSLKSILKNGLDKKRVSSPAIKRNLQDGSSRELAFEKLCNDRPEVALKSRVLWLFLILLEITPLMAKWLAPNIPIFLATRAKLAEESAQAHMEYGYAGALEAGFAEAMAENDMRDFLSRQASHVAQARAWLTGFEQFCLSLDHAGEVRARTVRSHPHFADRVEAAFLHAAEHGFSELEQAAAPA
ncbi:MAG: hypothetical protein ACYDDT_11755, partial [Sulfuricella sp.]